MKIGITSYRAAAGIALAAALLLAWMNLAVGLIGSENERANLMYYAVLAVGLIGSHISRFQPRGMSLTLIAMAITQAVIGVIALATGMHLYPGSSAPEILGLTGLFMMPFAASAWLFRLAAREQTAAAPRTAG